MAISRMHVRAHGRQNSKGRPRSAAAAVAYRCGVSIVDVYSGIEHDYRARGQQGDIRSFQLVGPGADELGTVDAFATALDRAEKRVNSTVGRDVEVPLPFELGTAAATDCARAFAADLGERYTTPIMMSVHAPGAGGRPEGRSTTAGP